MSKFNDNKTNKNNKSKTFKNAYAENRVSENMEYEDKSELFDELPFDEPFNVASATECTGLMPFAPENNSEITSYSDIYDVPLPKIVADGKSTSE